MEKKSSARGPVRAPAQERTGPIGSVGLGGARGFSRADLDFYPTDPAIGAMLPRLEAFDGGVWECACGDGALSIQLQRAGVDVVSTDLVDRGFGRGGVDFLKARRLRRPDVATNPPFTHWLQFAAHALALGAGKVALLGRVLLLDGWERAQFFQQTRLSRVWIIGRSKMRPRGAVDRGHKGMIAFAWYVWDRASTWRGGPVVRWANPRGLTA